MHTPTKDRLLPGGTMLSRPFRTRDAAMGFQTFDSRTIDGTGAFLQGELERLDQNLHTPLFTTTWSRDIDLREDVSLGDEFSSFLNSAYAATGGINPAGKNWISSVTNAIAGVALDIGKTINPLTPWGMELSWTLMELASAAQVNRPVDAQKYDVMLNKWDMDMDEQTYIGDAVLGFKGLVNLASVTPSNVVNGGTGSPLWINKTPDEMSNDIDTVLNAAWLASGYKWVPTRLLLPPQQFSYVVRTRLTNTNKSLLSYLQENTIAMAHNGRPLEIFPLKWLTGAGVSGTNRMVVYTKRKDVVRLPVVPLQRTPIEYKSIYQLVTYYGRIGVVENPYPEAVAYADGI